MKRKWRWRNKGLKTILNQAGHKKKFEKMCLETPFLKVKSQNQVVEMTMFNVIINKAKNFPMQNLSKALTFRIWVVIPCKFQVLFWKELLQVKKPWGSFSLRRNSFTYLQIAISQLNSADRYCLAKKNYLRSIRSNEASMFLKIARLKHPFCGRK